MISKSPKVSVVIPSYNHGGFISNAITSVLNQTYIDFELIIVDDASTDDSLDVISKFMDERIRVYINNENKGAVYTLNFAIKQAKGEYIALLNSDDLWEMNKLEKQVTILNNHSEIGAVYTDAKFINEDGKVLEKVDFSGIDMFNQANRSSGQWLKKFFFEQNCLCHPSILIRRSCYSKTGLYNSALRQLPDFAMWVKLLKTINIYILREKLAIFRILSNGQNASANNPFNRNQNKNEIYLIMKDFFDGISIKDFVEGFSDYIIKEKFLTPEEFLCEQAFIYFKNSSELSHLYKLIGIEKLYGLLQDNATREALRISYQFTENNFFQLTGGFELIDASRMTIPNVLMKNARLTFEKSPLIYNVIKYLVSKLLRR